MYARISFLPKRPERSLETERPILTARKKRLGIEVLVWFVLSWKLESICRKKVRNFRVRLVAVLRWRFKIRHHRTPRHFILFQEVGDTFKLTALLSRNVDRSAGLASNVKSTQDFDTAVDVDGLPKDQHSLVTADLPESSSGFLNHTGI